MGLDVPDEGRPRIARRRVERVELHAQARDSPVRVVRLDDVHRHGMRLQRAVPDRKHQLHRDQLHERKGRVGAQEDAAVAHIRCEQRKRTLAVGELGGKANRVSGVAALMRGHRAERSPPTL